MTHHTGNLQDKIRFVTGSRRIRIRSSNGQIVLSGVGQERASRRVRRRHLRVARNARDQCCEPGQRCRSASFSRKRHRQCSRNGCCF
jgi:hypothetical protein